MMDFAVLALFPGLMVFAAVSDMLTMTIPNRVSVVLVLGFSSWPSWRAFRWRRSVGTRWPA